MELKNVHKSRSIITVSSFAFSALSSHFPQLLKCDTDMVVSYHVAATLLATLLCLASYKQCSPQLLKMLYKGCNTDVLGVLLIYPHSSSGIACPQDHAYISVIPLTAVLQPINILYMSKSETIRN